MANSIPPAMRPIQLANAIQYAQAYRQRGEGWSTYQCVSYALREALGYREGLDEWILPVMAMLNDSPSAAEAWAKRQLENSLDRAFQRVGASNAS